MFVASGAGSTGAAGDDMATANANAAPGATRPVDQHVEFVVKVILFCRRRNAGGMGQCAIANALSLSFISHRVLFNTRIKFLRPFLKSLVSGGGGL